MRNQIKLLFFLLLATLSNAAYYGGVYIPSKSSWYGCLKNLNYFAYSVRVSSTAITVTPDFGYYIKSWTGPTDAGYCSSSIVTALLSPLDMEDYLYATSFTITNPGMSCITSCVKYCDRSVPSSPPSGSLCLVVSNPTSYALYAVVGLASSSYESPPYLKDSQTNSTDGPPKLTEVTRSKI